MKDVLKTAEAALAALRENGADMAGVVAAYTETREFNVDGGQFSLLRTLFDDSLSLAGYRQGRKGTAMINRFDDGSIQAAAGNACSRRRRRSRTRPGTWRRDRGSPPIRTAVPRETWTRCFPGCGN